MVENDHIHGVASKRPHQFGRQLRYISKRGIRYSGGINVDGYVDVAVRLLISTRVRAEKIGIQDLGACRQTLRQTFYELSGSWDRHT